MLPPYLLLPPRVKFEGASQGYEFSSEELEGEENNRNIRGTDESIEGEEKGVDDNLGKHWR
jgi:hypothetical protein